MLKIRILQISRAANELGLLRFIFLLALLGIVLFALFQACRDALNARYVAVSSSLLIAMLQTSRPDLRFLQTHFLRYKSLLFVEYFLLLIPVYVSLGLHSQWFSTGFLLLCNLMMPNLKSVSLRIRKISFFIKLIPVGCFEWRAGARKMQFLIIFIWLTGFFTSFLVVSIPVVLLILGILPWNFYEKGEPYTMIQAYEKGPGEFLLYKTRMLWLLFSVLSLPLILAFLMLHPEFWYIPVAEYVLLCTLHIYVVMVKYAFYIPNAKSPGAQVFWTLGASGLFIPVLIPLAWVLTYRFYRKSISNLKIFLNDYN